MPCQVPLEMLQADLSVTECVCWVRKRPLKAEANTETSTFQPCTARGPCFYQKTAALTASVVKAVHTKGTVDLKHGRFVYLWTNKPLQTDGKWWGNDSLWMAFFLPPPFWMHLIFWAAAYICTIERSKWCDVFQSKSRTELSHTRPKWLVDLP